MIREHQQQIAQTIRSGLADGTITMQEARKIAHDELCDDFWFVHDDASMRYVAHSVTIGNEHVSFGWLPVWVDDDSKADEWCKDNMVIMPIPFGGYRCATRKLTWHRNPDGHYTFIHVTML